MMISEALKSNSALTELDVGSTMVETMDKKKWHENRI